MTGMIVRALSARLPTPSSAGEIVGALRTALADDTEGSNGRLRSDNRHCPEPPVNVANHAPGPRRTPFWDRPMRRRDGVTWCNATLTMAQAMVALANVRSATGDQ